MLIHQDIRAPLIRFFYILFFIFFLHRLFFPSFGMAERCMSALLFPFLKLHASVNQSMRQRGLEKKEHHELVHELECLKEKYEALQSRLIAQEVELQYAQQTQELRDFAVRYEASRYVLCKILFKQCNEYEDIILIEGGQNHQFEKDDVVMYKNALIGKIVQVYSWYSKVILISDKRCRIAAQLKPRVQGICCGLNNGQLSLCFVPHFKEVSVGEIAFSNGQGLVYPHGFALGMVKHVATDLVAHDITLEPMYNIQDIDFVYVFSK